MHGPERKSGHNRCFQRYSCRIVQCRQADWCSKVISEAQRCITWFQNSLKLFNAAIPSLDVDTRWLSTFDIRRKAHAARLVLDAMCSSHSYLEVILISGKEWNMSRNICNLLEFAAKIYRKSKFTKHLHFHCHFHWIQYAFSLMQSVHWSQWGAFSEYRLENVDKIEISWENCL